MTMRTRLMKDERGAALIEAAVTIPIILLICVGIFEFGRAFQTWQVLTNAAREGARVAVITGTTEEQITEAITTYLTAGGLDVDLAEIPAPQNEPLVVGTGSRITVNYQFDFMLLNPIARLVVGGSETGSPLVMSATALMRNEGL